jgi:hypothetical protein
VFMKKQNGFALSTCVSAAPFTWFPCSSRLQCLSRLPHDPALTPSVDPSVSLIPPVNTSSSYYDGILLSHSLLLDPGIQVHFHRSGVPTHGFEYSGRFGNESCRNPFISNIRSPRYISRGNSFPGIGGFYTSSKNRSKSSATMPVHYRTGTGLLVSRFRLLFH